jgi:hypothetical protein
LKQLGVAIPSAGAGNTKWLWRLVDNRPIPEQVRVGLSDGTLTEVLDGKVHAGDALVTDMMAVPRRRFGFF